MSQSARHTDPENIPDRRLGVADLGMCESVLSGQIGPFWIMEQRRQVPAHYCAAVSS
jgi:hypothetical protein